MKRVLINCVYLYTLCDFLVNFFFFGKSINILYYANLYYIRGVLQWYNELHTSQEKIEKHEDS